MPSMPLYNLKRESVDKTFLFIHIPKTGGTAIESYFTSLGLTGFNDPMSYRAIRPFLKIPPTHFDYELCDKLFRLDRLYSFAIVRNPVQRFISEYRWAIEKSSLPENVKKYSVSDFIKYSFEMYERDENFLAGHLKPQRRFVGSKLSKSFKYEVGLNSIVTEVFRDTGLKPLGKIEIPVINRSSNKSVCLKDTDIEAIYRMYSDDFTLFGYSPDNPEL